VTARRAGRAVLAAVGLLLGAGSAGAADDLAALVAKLLEADRPPGAVTARAFVEPARPTAPPTPQANVALVLLPYSAGLEAELDAAKASLRDSVDSYTRAVPRVETARVDYERALVAAGGGALVRSGSTDAHGAARFEEVPAGEWLLLGWREGGHVTKRFKLRDQDAKRYSQVPTSVTYSIVTYWRSRIVVTPSETVEVLMSDRSVWMTAGRQEGSSPPGPVSRRGREPPFAKPTSVSGPRPPEAGRFVSSRCPVDPNIPS
jgi:hypothetical protein